MFIRKKETYQELKERMLRIVNNTFEKNEKLNDIFNYRYIIIGTHYPYGWYKNRDTSSVESFMGGKNLKTAILKMLNRPGFWYIVEQSKYRNNLSKIYNTIKNKQDISYEEIMILLDSPVCVEKYRSNKDLVSYHHVIVNKEYRTFINEKEDTLINLN